MENKMYMEDVISISVAVSNLIEAKLKIFEIVLTPKEEDDIHNKVFEVLESVSNMNYRREM